MPTLRRAGGTGGTGAARRRREYERPKRTSLATTRATDTALVKAGVERGNKEKRHNSSRASRSTLLTQQVLRTRLPSYRANRDPGDYSVNSVTSGRVRLSL